eukprot:PhF_6_TR932/c0_g1_i2/m.1639
MSVVSTVRHDPYKAYNIIISSPYRSEGLASIEQQRIHQDGRGYDAWDGVPTTTNDGIGEQYVVPEQQQGEDEFQYYHQQPMTSHHHPQQQLQHHQNFNYHSSHLRITDMVHCEALLDPLVQRHLPESMVHQIIQQQQQQQLGGPVMEGHYYEEQQQQVMYNSTSYYEEPLYHGGEGERTEDVVTAGYYYGTDVDRMASQSSSGSYPSYEGGVSDHHHHHHGSTMMTSYSNHTYSEGIGYHVDPNQQYHYHAPQHHLHAPHLHHDSLSHSSTTLTPEDSTGAPTTPNTPSPPARLVDVVQKPDAKKKTSPAIGSVGVDKEQSSNNKTNNNKKQSSQNGWIVCGKRNGSGTSGSSGSVQTPTPAAITPSCPNTATTEKSNPSKKTQQPQGAKASKGQPSTSQKVEEPISAVPEEDEFVIQLPSPKQVSKKGNKKNAGKSEKEKKKEEEKLLKELQLERNNQMKDGGCQDFSPPIPPTTSNKAAHNAKTSPQLTKQIKQFKFLMEKADDLKKFPAARLQTLTDALTFAPNSALTELHLEIAELFLELGEHIQAREHASHAVRTSIVHECRYEMILGRCHISLVEPFKARPHLEKAFQLAHEIGDDNVSKMPCILNQLGNMYELMWDFPKALVHYQQALDLSKSLKDMKQEWESTVNITLAHGSLGDIRFALEMWEQNVRLSRALHHYPYVTCCLGHMARLYCAIGEFEPAMQCHLMEKEVYSKNQDLAGVAQSLNGMGILCKFQNKMEESLSYHLEELSIVHSMGLEARLLESLGCCGIIFRELKNFEKSRELHQKEWNVAQSMVCNSTRGKALYHMATLDYAEYKHNHNDILKRTALERYRRGLEMVSIPMDNTADYASRVGCLEVTWLTLDKLQIFYREEEEKGGESLPRAIMYSDATKLPLLAKAFSTSSSPSSSSFDHDRFGVCTAIEDTETMVVAVNALGLDAVVVYSICGDDDPQLFAYILNARSGKWKTTTLTLGDDSVRVLLAQDGVLRKLSASGETDLPLLPHRYQSRAEQSAHKDPEATSSESLFTALQYLYKDLYAPLAEDLKSCVNLMIVPDGFLHNVPFHALHNGVGSSSLNDSTLVHHHVISVVSSLEVMLRLHDRRRVDGIPASVGPIRFTSTGRPPSAQRLFDIFKPTSSEEPGQAFSCITLRTPYQAILREEHSGMFVVDKEDSPTHAEDVVKEWKFRTKCVTYLAGNDVEGASLREDLPWVTLHRVPHETCVGLMKGLLARGADNVVVPFWKLPSHLPMNNVNKFWKAIEDAVEGKTTESSSDVRVVSSSVRSVLLEYKNKIPLEVWANIVVFGLG